MRAGRVESISPRARRVLAVVGALYLVAVAAIAFWPTPVDGVAYEAIQRTTAVAPAIRHDGIEIVANVMLFVPFGVIGVLIALSRVVVIAAAAVFSTLIELVQGAFLEQRTASVTDVIANTAGAVVGVLLALAILARRVRASRSH
ncbi:VanZ family protein [Homoserinibacter sp. GY 40078]|uniref:VanZ family protein n=1 Tax=Homoserinibacter sp. GY 40078 TaxID=2603275 RepID=UPI0011CA2B21|nr:VanZ family protein [Homoserinibacter sp. GY 40078]TXK19494.1 VanZ family protein [Homoserinibacter sp. GY 40078]